MTDVMMDLETWGTAPGCAIRSVGAVAFERRGAQQTQEFYRNISTESCTLVGLRMERATIEWWGRQTADAKKALLADQRSLPDVIEEFHEWFVSTGAEHLWCQGPNFDDAIWQAACRKVGLATPWKFYNVRCTRTVFDLASYDTTRLSRSGIHHTALADAVHQVRMLRDALDILELGEVR